MRHCKIRAAALLLALLMALTAPVSAAETASAVRLSRTEGTVEVCKSSGKKLSLMSKMRLYGGYHVKTGEESYAWINLDNAKLLKEDAESEVEVRKNGKQLEVNLWSGNLFFDVAEELENDETLNISTSTMIVGVRGTSGWVEVTDRWRTRVGLLEGSLECVAEDPVSGELKTARLESGDVAECVTYPQDRAGDKCEIIIKKSTVEDVPGFALTELVENLPLCDKIRDAGGLDIPKELAKTAGGLPEGRLPSGEAATPEVRGEAQRRQEQDEEDLHKQLEEIEKELKKQPDTPAPGVWETPPQKTEEKSPPFWEDWGESSDPADTTVGPLSMKLTDVQVEGYLSGQDAFEVLANTDDQDTTPKKNVLEVDTGLTVAAGKTLTLRSGVDVEVYAGRRLQVNGSMHMAGSLDSNGTVAVTSGDTLRVGGSLTASGGSVEVTAGGRIVVDGVFSRSGGSMTLASTAVVLARQFAAGAAPSGWAVSDTADSAGYYRLRPLYTVTFDANRGTVSPASAQTGGDGKLASLPTPTAPTPNMGSYATYTFEGWFDAKRGGNEITTGTELTQDITAYAHWDISSWDWDYRSESNTVYIFGKGPTSTYEGSGSMDQDPPPWDTYLVEKMIVEEGIVQINNLFKGGTWGFYECPNLTEVEIPHTVTLIRLPEMIEGCPNLTTINFTGTEEQWNAIDKDPFSQGYTIPSTVTINFNCTPSE